MGDVVSIDELRLGRNILGIYKDYLENTDEEERDYIEKVVIRLLIPKVIKRLKDSNFPINFEDLNNNVDFYNILFDELCKSLIDNGSFTKGATPEAKQEILNHLYDSREADKERLLYDEDMYDEKPEISEYEFDISRIMRDITYYLNNKMSNSVRR